MRNIVAFKEPSLKPLPPSVSKEDIRSAVLPVKIVAMRSAITQCEDLQELLHYRAVADGLAAAARTIKHEIPEQCAAMNRVAKEAVLRLGQLLITYSNTPKGVKGSKAKELSDRGAVCKKLGVDRDFAGVAVRLASAPKEAIEKALDSKQTHPNVYVNRNTPAADPRRKNSKHRYSSDAVLALLGSAGGRDGLLRALTILRGISHTRLAELSPEETRRVHLLCVEGIELLDAIDQRLPHERS